MKSVPPLQLTVISKCQEKVIAEMKKNLLNMWQEDQQNCMLWPNATSGELGI